MDYPNSGATGVRVFPLCFGTMSFGAEADERASAEMFHRVRISALSPTPAPATDRTETLKPHRT
ncbi:hypothetical protein [Goodfellowiella coeruleoviolacea]|uniref:Aldo/keto reductase n=1 Tax=Goodfellowiella coeruleoviolacea TaxID=334858 RepID=A0AAE3KIJ5_9PSEU|nr:hypothetical protein [Goodfellowiella coeruleoviolacea]MCP2167464.1 hypothetical protein [Goodfellowiella coeruleoviolacea]